MNERIKHLEKRLIRVSNIETYTPYDAMRKATLMFKIATQISEEVQDKFIDDNLKKLIAESLKNV